jgi:hypothetical protein
MLNINWKNIISGMTFHSIFKLPPLSHESFRVIILSKKKPHYNRRNED